MARILKTINIYSFLFTFIIILLLFQFAYSFEREHFVFWPNGTIPFYVNPTHFDKEQMLTILSSLSLFAFKTCLQFNPVMVEPTSGQHVMLFENPRGIRKCVVDMEGHAKEEPHRITLGYECLRTPLLEMFVMKALGFPYEHNRAMRDIYIDVQFENIEPSFLPLFTKEKKLPPELRVLPYDIHSVMHFGERDYSKNGHRSIIFKNGNVQQNRIGLSKGDLRKIEIIYGPECQRRDRQVKIDICKNYPSVRRKRETDLNAVKNLRVNRDITPPSENLTNYETDTLKDFKIENEVQDLIEHVYKITAAAIENERVRLCNHTKAKTRILEINNDSSHGISDIIRVVVNHVKVAVNEAVTNLTLLCDEAKSMELFQRFKCGWSNNNRCPKTYKSTLPGPVKYSTQHRPIIIQSTKHEGRGKKPQYANWYRSGNDTMRNTTRRRRDLTDAVNVTDNKNNGTDKTDTSVVVDTDKFGNNEKDTKESLRTATMVFNDKKINFAPVRRSFREDRDVSDLGQERDFDGKRDASNLSLERVNKEVRLTIRPMKQREDLSVQMSDRQTEHRGEKRERLREKERKGHREEKRPQKNRSKSKRGRHNTRLPETVPLSKMNEEFYAERIWPDGIIRYYIARDSKYNLQRVRARLNEVNDILKRKTCVRLEEISKGEGRKYTDYLVLDASADYVTGRVGGRQNFGSIELFEGGQHRQHAAMMVMAMLGFYFEVSRHDRDKYVRVHNRHIRPDKLHHFEKIRSDATLAVPYDYASATHPAWQFWRKVGKKGISTVATFKDQDPDGSIMKSLGQNEQLLSNIDIIKINSVYGVHCFQNKKRKMAAKDTSFGE